MFACAMESVRRSGVLRVSLAAAASSLALACLLAGCGGGSKDSSASGSASAAGTSNPSQSASTRTSSPKRSNSTSAQAAAGGSGSSGEPAVAYVAGVPISTSSYQHWLSVEQALHAVGSAGHQALGFLITSRWMLDEATARGIRVSSSQVKQRFDQIVHQSYPKAGSLHSFMASSHQTETDLLGRVEVELLRARIAAKLTAGQSAAQRKATLASFERSFHEHWKHKTTCKAGYVMEDCAEYKGGSEGLSGGSTSSSAPKSTPNGEVYSPPGAFSISSSAFERNGALPTQYTCAGAGTSPPLSWQKVPSKAAELVLFVIDDSSNGSNGGIRWVVGGIDPTSTGVAAGQVPAGGIVGTNTAGQAAYSAICPAHGKSDTIEIVLYALNKKIPLSPGFQPAVAESEYGKGKALIASAITYAVASRP
jgi:phosphatidylethanolamine-binding protein (PEBP) family uncharacterized protein